MAGNYADVPAPRMPWDRDGSALVFINGGIPTQQAGSMASQLNKESTSDQMIESNPGSGATLSYLCVIFPELRDLVALFWGSGGSSFGVGAVQVTTSPDTTNGIDGTWTVINASMPTTYPNIAGTDYRTAIQAMSSTGIKAVRAGVPGSLGASGLWCCQFHIYGSIATGQNPDRIRIWHPTLDQEVSGAYFDGGNIPRGSTADIQFRLKNNSSTYTANNIVVSIEAPTEWTPTVATQYTFSTGGSYTATQNITSIAPGAISGLITLRRITPTNAHLSLHSLRIKAIPTTWT